MERKIKKTKKKKGSISDALMKVAVGYSVEEVTEEYAEVDGEMKLLKRKETKKDVPPDLKAVQMILSGSDAETSKLSDEELEKEKKRLLKELAEEEKKRKKGDRRMEFEKDELEQSKTREQKRKEKLVKEIAEDFNRRREERRSVENGWKLNMNFLSGNQYCDVSPLGEVLEEDTTFYWQSKRAFNHIAPLVDARVAKILGKKPVLKVRAFSDEDGDLKASKLATGVLRYAFERIRFNDTLARGTVWSETCGSTFYKIAWNEKGGRQIAENDDGEPVYEGEVEVSVATPFEIFPDKLGVESLEEIESLIHAQAVSVDEIDSKFGVKLQGEDLSDSAVVGYSEPTAGKTDVKNGFSKSPVLNSVILIERYTKPTKENPDGKLEIVAGGELLYEGPLPYRNGERGERTFPFVKQDCMRLPASFFGASIVDRLIPVQRAYNAVRNRKHEFLNRIALGVVAVEDGSVDVDELASEGLQPGKVLVYRQGGKAPEMMDCGPFPNEFEREEEWLEKEFSLVSGVSDLSQNSTPARVTSATGLQLLISQDDSRLASTLESLEGAMKEIGRQILRLYRQFAGSARLMTLTGENKKTQVYYFNASEIVGQDIVFDCEERDTSYEKREILLKLLDAGLFSDDDGKISKENKNRVLEAFGYGSYENATDISALHIAKAGEENLALKTDYAQADEYDDHGLHIGEHIRFLLSSEFKKCKNQDEIKKKFIAHIDEHKNMRKKGE